MNNRKFYTACFTGHRAKSLPWGYNESGLRFLLCKFRIKQKIKKAIKLGCNHFISGMALGTDMLCAKIILGLKSKYPDIKLECALPCINQTKKWSEASKKEYLSILNNADIKTYVTNTTYTPYCMQKRNRYMVDSADVVIAVYNGTNGGTKQTLEYAQSKNKIVTIIKP